MNRIDGRKINELREVTIERKYLRNAEGSVLISIGNTKVLCTATAEERVPPFIRGTGQGWVTAEYAMLPRSSQQRISRERQPKGRTQEIQRLIGRSLRSITDLSLLGERSILIDCDVIQADGGTRTAAITGAFVALTDTINSLLESGALTQTPILEEVAATSVGIVDGKELLDLCYEEDSTAEVDMNIVMTGKGKFIEVQGTAEGVPYSKEDMDKLIALATGGISELIGHQNTALAKR